ncbi:MAG: hypothetical protein AB7G28_01550 [Pirellulales bacterium]
MIYNSPLDYLPLWMMFVATVGVVLVAVEIGYQLGRYRRTHAPETDAPVGAMVGATLGLLAFILAFTFGLAASRFDERRRTVLDEANAIGTTYLRAGTLDEPERTETRRLLREYVDLRLSAIEQGKIEPLLPESARLHNQLWSQAEAAARKDRSDVTGLFLESLNQTIDLHATRLMVGLRSRIPLTIWGALYSVALLTMATMGYQEGLSGTRRSIASLAVVIIFSIVMLLIVDLDRPLEGQLRTSQQPLIDLQKSMAADIAGAAK